MFLAAKVVERRLTLALIGQAAQFAGQARGSDEMNGWIVKDMAKEAEPA